jgi:hypothetical protein
MEPAINTAIEVRTPAITLAILIPPDPHWARRRRSIHRARRASTNSIRFAIN